MGKYSSSHKQRFSSNYAENLHNNDLKNQNLTGDDNFSDFSEKLWQIYEYMNQSSAQIPFKPQQKTENEIYNSTSAKIDNLLKSLDALQNAKPENALDNSKATAGENNTDTLINVMAQSLYKLNETIAAEFQDRHVKHTHLLKVLEENKQILLFFAEKQMSLERNYKEYFQNQKNMLADQLQTSMQNSQKQKNEQFEKHMAKLEALLVMQKNAQQTKILQIAEIKRKLDETVNNLAKLTDNLEKVQEEEAENTVGLDLIAELDDDIKSKKFVPFSLMGQKPVNTDYKTPKSWDDALAELFENHPPMNIEQKKQQTPENPTAAFRFIEEEKKKTLR